MLSVGVSIINDFPPSIQFMTPKVSEIPSVHLTPFPFGSFEPSSSSRFLRFGTLFELLESGLGITYPSKRQRRITQRGSNPYLAAHAASRQEELLLRWLLGPRIWPFLRSPWLVGRRCDNVKLSPRYQLAGMCVLHDVCVQGVWFQLIGYTVGQD